jgi:uncharacterized protein YutE (UPF0331/DUF86 family)
MKLNDYILVLESSLKQFNEALSWLKRSYEKSLRIQNKEQFTEDDLDALENLASRYAKACDLLIHKVFRSIDKVEFEDEGTLIDVANRAEKRELIDSVDELREMKDLRNQIVHEYISENLKGLFNDIMNFIPKLFEIQKKVEKYCKKYEIAK